jgi:hypothetical protein
MPTGLSSTEPTAALSPARGDRSGAWAEVRRATSDTRALLSFRASTLRGRARRLATYGVLVMALLTLAASWLPAYLPTGEGRRTDVLSLLPTAMIGILVIAVISAAASAGGRELMPRDQAVSYPVSPLTDHFGALLMAPLNIAWLLQTWTLLGATAYVIGPSERLPLVQLPVLLWLVCATSIAQVIGWTMEWVRRGPYGVWAIRTVSVVLGLLLAYLIADDRLVPLLQESPTLQVTIASLRAETRVDTWYALVVLVLVVLSVLAVALGGLMAAAVVRRPARDELRLESSAYQPRAHPTSDFMAMVRTDRVGIWRSVPLRRGLLVLMVMPGLVAIAGGLEWHMLPILPGLVASGGALLFGVNSWALDGRGALWRDSLPVDARIVFVSRVYVLVEVLLVASAGTMVLASLRAGVPSPSELAAVGAATLVVVFQVVSASLRWSVRRPFSVDLRSARATPAPPLVMVGYSSRLALATTLVGMFFSVLARVPWEWSVLIAVPFLLVSAARLVGTGRTWTQPDTRARVVATVAS